MRGRVREHVRRARRVLAGILVIAGVGLLAAPAVVAQAEVRTRTDLLGYSLDAEAAPISVLFFENFIPIPTDPGEPQFEISASFTSTSLGTGPRGRATASTIWPGAALGDGFGTVTGDESQSYPVKAQARYPGRGEQDWHAEQLVASDVGMQATARGLDIHAVADSSGLPAEAAALVTLGQVRSESTSTVEQGRAISTSTSTISQVSLLAGTIVLEGIETHLVARSNGGTASTAGTTTVGGITVMGMPVRLTDEGARVVPPAEGDTEEEDDGDAPLGIVQDLLSPLNEALDQLTDDLVADGLTATLGIDIQALDQVETVEGAIAQRTASGVVITIDTAVLRGYLDSLVQLVPLGDIFAALPEDDSGTLTQVQGLVFEALGLGPKIQYVIGAGAVAASAAPPFELPEVPLPLAPPPAPPPATTGTAPVTSGGAVPPSTGVSLPPPPAGGVVPSVPTAEVAPPSASPPSSPQPSVLSATPIENFAGIPLAFFGVAMLVAAIPTLGMRTIREAAVGLGADTDVPSDLPDLRGGA